jgi:uncharacterized protein YbaP (TraB family)
VVKSPTATVVLFGSVHLLPPDVNWEPPALVAALNNATEVWFEIPMDDAASLAASQAALATGLQPAGSNLSDALSFDDRGRLAHAAKVCGLPPAGLEKLKPWLADITISVASYRLAGAMVENGVERQLSASLPAGVQRRAFETPEQQIGFLAGSPLTDQVASLRETLDEVAQGPETYHRLVRAWMAGDPAAIRRDAIDPMMRQAPGVYKTLVTDRNLRWEDVIAERLKGSGQAVVVVGVGHLVGPDGLPTLLRARGFTVEGP